MKRTISLLLVAVLLLGVMSIAAAEEPALTVQSVAESVAPGESFYTDVVLSRNPGVAALVLDLDYDHTALRLDAVDGVVDSGTWDLDTVTEDDVLLWYSSANVSADGTVARLHFTALESAAEGQYAITFKSPDAWRGVYNDTDAAALSLAYGAGYVTVENPAPLPAASIYGGKVTARAGETVDFPLYLADNPGIAFLKLRLGYGGLTLAKAENGAALSGFQPGQSLSNNPFTLIWNNASNSTENGVLATLRFTVPETAEDGDYALTLEVVEAYNEAYEKVNVSAVPMALTVRNFIYGDVNRDGNINGLDGIRLAQYLADWDVQVDMSAADVNGDGRVNGLDGIRLAQYLADWDVQLGK